MTICDNCGSGNVVKQGWRYNKSVPKQKYFCHKCRSWFVIDDGFKRMRHRPEDIARAIDEYADGMSLKKIKKHLQQHDGVKMSRWGIRNWIVKYAHLLKKPRRDLALRRLRAASTSMKNM